MPSSSPAIMAFSAANSFLPASRSAVGATSMSMSRNGSSGLLMPTSCVICKKFPPILNSPSSASYCPVRIFKMVDLPTPFGPTMAACSPGATPKLTSKNSCSAPGGLYASSETDIDDTVYESRRVGSAFQPTWYVYIGTGIIQICQKRLHHEI